LIKFEIQGRLEIPKTSCDHSLVRAPYHYRDVHFLTLLCVAKSPLLEKSVTPQRNNVKASLHWQSLLAKLSATATHDSHESDRMISILCHAAQGSQGKYIS
jgi:hypothetical protein